eukprot:scaffold1744_cov340-Prasinococcus_capsulatus_cf.AAC.25
MKVGLRGAGGSCSHPSAPSSSGSAGDSQREFGALCKQRGTMYNSKRPPILNNWARQCRQNELGTHVYVAKRLSIYDGDGVGQCRRWPDRAAFGGTPALNPRVCGWRRRAGPRCNRAFPLSNGRLWSAWCRRSVGAGRRRLGRDAQAGGRPAALGRRVCCGCEYRVGLGFYGHGVLPRS